MILQIIDLNLYNPVSGSPRSTISLGQSEVHTYSYNDPYFQDFIANWSNRFKVINKSDLCILTTYYQILEGVCEMKFSDWSHRFRVNRLLMLKNGSKWPKHCWTLSKFVNNFKSSGLIFLKYCM